MGEWQRGVDGHGGRESSLSKMVWKQELEDATEFDWQEGNDELKGSQGRGKAVGRVNTECARR